MIKKKNSNTHLKQFILEQREEQNLKFEINFKIFFLKNCVKLSEKIISENYA